MKALRIGAEEKHGGVGRFPVLEKVEVGQQRLCRRLRLQGKTALAARRLKEPIDALAREIRKRGLVACGGVEGQCPQRTQPVQVIHQAGVDLARQRAHVLDAAANQFAAGLAHQLPHFGSALFVVHSPDIHEPGLPATRCVVEFPFSRGHAALALEAVAITEDAEIDIAAFDLLQIDPIGAAVRGRNFLEQKDLGNEPAQHGVA